MLIPASPLLTEFRKAMLRDPQGTSELIDEAVSSWMLDELDAYAEPLAKCFAAQSLESIRLAKRALGRRYVEEISKGVYPDDVEMQRTAQWLAGLEVVVKALSEEGRAKLSAKAKAQNESGARAGKRGFGFLVDTKSESDVRGTHPTNLSPHAEGLVVTDETGQVKVNDQMAGTESEHQLARHQSQWEQLNDGLKSMAADMGKDAGKVDAMISMEGPNGPENAKVNLGSAAANLTGLGERFNPLTYTVKSVQLVAPVDASPELAQKVNVYNQVGYATAGNVPAWLRRLSSSDWQGLVGPGDPQASGLSRMFDRVTAGSSVLRALPGVDDKYAEWARFVGTVGPEADRALGPHIRRAAYRYRGTEKTPDAELRADLSTKSGTAYAGVIALADQEVPAKEVTAIGDRMPSEGNPVVTSMINRARHGAQGDQLRMQVASDVAVGDMLRYLPEDPFTAKLSEKSGHVLPSHGVLFNAKGELVSQSVGSSDDHYLPFDLKNLASLRGGQYVRTRVAGGLTGEDVYTAIQSGARMVTVASSSGVFTMEMDPAFRGARGNSDKAREMYTRYLQILDAVEASGLYLQDVPGPMKAKLRQEAAASVIPTGEKKVDEEAVRAAYERRLDAMRRDQSALDADELERIQAEAEDEVLNNPQTKRMSNPQIRRTIDDVYEDKVEAARADKVQALRLNAAGYDMALKTLQQQYPYFVRSVSYTSLKDLGGTAKLRANESGEDRGYVRPGGLRAEKVRSGFYETGNPQGPGPKRPREAAEKPGGAAGGGSTSGAPGGAAKPAAGAASPAAPAGGRLRGAMQLNQQVAQAQATQALQELKTGLGALNRKIAPNGVPGKDGYNPTGSKESRAASALSALAAGTMTPEQVLADPSALEALQDEKAVKSGVNDIWELDLNDAFQGGLDPEDFGGATDAAEFQAWLADRVRAISDAGELVDPFGGDYDPTTPMTMGTKAPMHPDMDFVDPREIEGFVSGQRGAPLMKIIETRGWIGANGKPEAATKVKADIKDSLEVLQQTKTLLEQVAHGGQVDFVEDKMKFVLSKVPGGKERLARALGHEPGPDDMNLSTGNLDTAADQLQQAWSLWTTSRAVESLVPPDQGGGLSPKRSLLRGPASPQEELAAKSLEPDLDDPAVVASLLASMGIGT